MFLDRLRYSLGGKSLNDFHTEEMFAKRRLMLEQRGDIVPWNMLPEWIQYQKNVRNLTEKNYRKFKDIINPQNKPRQRGKYELDHIVPLFYGFQNDIPVELIASIDNLQMLSMSENRIKGKKYEPISS